MLDEHGLEACWLFPTLGMLYEELLKHDLEAVTQTFTAFNRWLDDDWGFDYQDRIFAAPYLTLADLDWAIRELEWALDRGARMIVMRAGRADHRHRPPQPVRPAVRPVLGARERGRHHRRRARRRQRLLAQRLRRRRLRGRLQRRRLRPDDQELRDRARRCYDFLARRSTLGQVVQALPRPAGRVGRERRRVPPRPVPQAALAATRKMPGYFTEDPVEIVPAQHVDQPVLGGRRRRVVD